MKLKMLPYFLLLLISVNLTGCLEEEKLEESFTINGLRPIYIDEYRTFSVTTPQPIKSLGKIYYKSPYIFVIEKGKGIHIIDNINPTTPIAVKFINLPACKDVAIRGNYMYASNYTDLVTLDMSDFNNISLVNRQENVYPGLSNYPEGYNGRFECVDHNKGFVIGWEQAELTNPECAR